MLSVGGGGEAFEDVGGDDDEDESLELDEEPSGGGADDIFAETEAKIQRTHHSPSIRERSISRPPAKRLHDQKASKQQRR